MVAGWALVILGVRWYNGAIGGWRSGSAHAWGA